MRAIPPRLTSRSGALILGALSALLFLWATFGSRFVFPYLTTNRDEPVYLSQADALAQGLLKLPKTETSRFLPTYFQQEIGDSLVFKYTPVHAATLWAGKRIFGDYSFSLGLIAALAALCAYWMFLELGTSRRISLLATMIMVLSPVFLLQSITYLPYVGSLLRLTLALALFFRGSRKRSPLFLALSGAALALVAFQRPFDGIMLGAPMALGYLTLARGDLRRALAGLSWVALGALPVLALIFAFNHHVTGNWLQFPFKQHPLDTFGFGEKRYSPTSIHLYYSPSAGVRHAFYTLKDIAFWCFGGLVFIALGFYFSLGRKRWNRATLYALFPSFLIGNIFWWGAYLSSSLGGPHYYGPQYHLPALLPISLASAQGLCSMHRRKPKLALILLALGLCFNLIPLTGSYLGLRKPTEWFRMAYAPFEKTKLDHALVILPQVEGPELLYSFPTLRNSPIPGGPVVYAPDAKNGNFELIEAFSGRDPYLFRLFNLPKGQVKTRLDPIQVLNLEHIEGHMELVNPLQCPRVQIYARSGSSYADFMVDHLSASGKKYRIDFGLGTGKRRSTASMSRKSGRDLLFWPRFAIDPTKELVLGMSVICPDRMNGQGTASLFEHYFYIAPSLSQQNAGKRPKPGLRILIPSSTSSNLDFDPRRPVAGWVASDLEGILAIHLRGED